MNDWNKEMFKRHKQHIKQELSGLFAAFAIVLFVFTVTVWIF